MPNFLVTYQRMNRPHDPESLTKARDSLLKWAQKHGRARVAHGRPVPPPAPLPPPGQARRRPRLLARPDGPTPSPQPPTAT